MIPKVLLSFSLMLLISLPAYNQLSPEWIVGFNSHAGVAIQNSDLKTGPYDGYWNLREDWNDSFTDITDRFGYSYGFELTTGFRIRNFFQLYTGIRYNQRKENLISYCHVCDFVTPPIPAPFTFTMVEIPIGIRLDFFSNNTWNPFFSQAFFWSKTLSSSTIGFSQWNALTSLGINYAFRSNMDFHLTVGYARSARLKQEAYPHFQYEEIRIRLGGTYHF